MRRFKAAKLLGLLLILISAMFAVRCAAQETQRQKQEQSPQHNQYRDQAQATQQDQSQHDSQLFAGKISEKYGKFYLEEAHTKSSYLLDGAWQPKRFLNRKVRVTGSLDADKNVLHVISISPTP